MYSSKQNVNILTALLVAHGIRHAVVCPGSRNSPIVHNLNECPEIQCYPVTDERKHELEKHGGRAQDFTSLSEGFPLGAPGATTVSPKQS